MRKDLTEVALRGVYSTLLYLLLPATVYHLIWRGVRVREYFQRWGERYASYSRIRNRPCVWLHAVSVGEVNAAVPLVERLRRDRPDIRWVVTTFTPTGSERVRVLWGDAVDHVYLPYDVPGSVGRFLDHFRPQLALIMETELWPNLMFGCRDRGIPVHIVNARLSARSLRGYRLLRPLIGRALRTARRVLAQSGEDAHRFIELGATSGQVITVGNLKFDIAAPADLSDFVAMFRRHVPGSRPVWIAASTHEGEETAIVEMHRALRMHWPDLLLLWAPRHRERFAKAEGLARSAGWQVSTRRARGWPGLEDGVFVIDTLGELMEFYACAQVAFVGGSLQPVGGHNLLEPAVVGTPSVTGPHLHNFAEISQCMQREGAISICADAHAARCELERLLADPEARRAMARAGTALLESGRGATERTLECIGPDLPAWAEGYRAADDPHEK